MTNDFDNLEREIERQLSDVRPALNVDAPEEITQRARLAARVTLDERLLAEAPSPTPSDQALADIRAAVRTVGRRPHRGHLRWVGILATAAAIALGIGLAERFGRQTPAKDDVIAAPTDEVVVEAYVEATDDLLEPTELTASLEEDLEELEQTISGWESSWGDLDAALDVIESNLQKQSRTDDDNEGQLTRTDADQAGVYG